MDRHSLDFSFLFFNNKCQNKGQNEFDFQKIVSLDKSIQWYPIVSNSIQWYPIVCSVSVVNNFEKRVFDVTLDKRTAHFIFIAIDMVSGEDVRYLLLDSISQYLIVSYSFS